MNTDERERSAAPPSASRLRLERWWGLAGGIALGAGDTLLAEALGFSFQINGQDATLMLVAYFSTSFGLLGFLLGYVIERRRHERHTAAIIAAQAETIASTRARLAQSEKLAALGQLAATIAHEVRNPLAVIRSASQELGEALPADEEGPRRACSFIIAEIDRLGNVISSLLAFARPPQLDLREVRIPDLIDQALLLARAELATKRIRVERDETEPLPPVRADADLMRQVLLGLVTNAAEALSTDGTIGVRARRVNGAVEIDVSDTGPGIPADVRSRVFEPFFTTRPKGTGLGLAIARQIVQAHGGRIEVGDHPGGGALFAVHLPVADGVGAA